MQRNRPLYIFTQESFPLQGILDDINEHYTSFLDCKHMVKAQAQAHDEKRSST